MVEVCRLFELVTTYVTAIVTFNFCHCQVQNFEISSLYNKTKRKTESHFTKLSLNIISEIL